MKFYKTLRKRGLALFLVLTMCLSLLPAQAMAADAGTDTAPPVTEAELAPDTMGFSGGSGTADDPYLISSAGGLRYLAQVVNSVDTTNYHEKYFALTNDIDLGGAEWTPIGIDVNHAFWGTFYGGGHTISNFTCNRDVAGLFGWVAYAKIYNLTISDATVTASGQDCAAGALIAVDYCGGNWSYSTELDNCHVVGSKVQASGTYSGAAYRPCAGGLVGTASRKLDIRYCTVENSNISSSHIAGGVLGSARINRCTITISNTACIGGSVSSEGKRDEGRAGGILGSAADWVRGYNDTNTVIGCYTLSISSCLNTASVTTGTTGTSSRSGGIIGYFSTGNKPDVSSCASLGLVSKGSNAAVGYSYPSITTTTCYTDAETAKAKLPSSWNKDGEVPLPKVCPGCNGCTVSKETPGGDRAVEVIFRVKNGQWEAPSLKQRTQEYTCSVTAEGKLEGGLPTPMNSSTPGKWYGLRGGVVSEFTASEIRNGVYTQPAVFIYAYPQQTHTVTFDLRDGTDLVYLAVPEGEAIPENMFPDTASHAGAYTFSGWEYANYQYGDRFTVNIEGYEGIIFTQNPGYADWSASKAVTDDIVLYAKWDAYNVYYAQFETSGGPDVPSQRFTDPDAVVRPEICGWTISDWCYALYTDYMYDTIPVLHEWYFGHTSSNDHNWSRLLALSTVYCAVDDNHVMRLYGLGVNQTGSYPWEDKDDPDSIDSLSISKAAPEEAAQSSMFDYTLTVVNNSNVTKAVTVTDKLPDRTSFVSCDPAVGNSTVSYNAATGTVTWTPTVRPNGGSDMLKIKVKVADDATAGTKIENTATLTSGDNSTIDSEPVTTTVTEKETLTDISKKQVERIPEGVKTSGTYDPSTLSPKDENGKYVVKDGTAALLYEITVTGDAGANYIVTDKDATWVGGDGEQLDGKGTAISGTIAEDKTLAVIYVTREFSVTEGDTSVKNQAFLAPGNDTELKPADGRTPGVDEDGNLPSNEPETPVTPGAGGGDDPQYSIAVTKTITPPDGGVTADSEVTYTVIVKNTSDAPLYDLEITDTMDAVYDADKMPAGLRLKEVISQAVAGNGENINIERIGTGELNLHVPLRNPNDGTLMRDENTGEVLRDEQSTKKVNVYTWLLPGEFKKGAAVTLVYTATVTNDTSDEVELYNIADATAYTTPEDSGESSEPEQQSIELLSLRTALAARGRVGVSGSSSTGTGSVGGSNSGTTTGPVRPKNFTVTYKNSAEDADPIRTVSVTNGTNHTVLNGGIAAAPEGKVFAGWQDGDGNTYQPGSEVKITGDLTLTAIWEDKPADAVEYELTYHSNDGTEKMEKQTASSPTASYTFTTRANCFEREGWHFKGWNTEANGSGTAYSTGVEIILQSSAPTVNLYAQWEKDVTPPDEYTYILTCHDGTGEADVQTETTTAEKHTFVIPTVSRPGYELLGWSETDGGSVEYKAGHRITLQSSNPKADLYAVWKELETVPGAPSDEDIQGLGIKVSVVCNANETHDESIREEYDLRDGTFKPLMGRDGKSCTLRIIPDAYVEQFNEEHGAHSYDETSVQGFVDLIYVGSDPDIDGQSDDEELPSEQDAASAPAGDKTSEGTDSENISEEASDEDSSKDADELFTGGPNENSGETDGPIVTTDEEEENTAADGAVLSLNSEDASTGSWQLKDPDQNTVTFSVYCEKEEPDTVEVTVIWLDGENGGLIDRKSVDVPKDHPTQVPKDKYPDDPERDGYRFTGWSEPVDNGDGTIIITAQWVEAPDTTTVTVTWRTGYGANAVIKTESIPRNSDYSDLYPDNPSRPGSYRFNGWSVPVVDQATGNITITAQWTYTGGTDGGTGTGGGTATTPPAPIPDDPAPLDPGASIDDQEVPLAGAVGLNATDHFAYINGYEDDTVRPAKDITRAEVATIFFRLMTEEYRVANWSTENTFSDVKAGDWYNNAISTCVKAGIIKGYEDGTFRPNQSITRAEFAAIAARFLGPGANDEGTGDFADTAGKWYSADVRKAAKAGWISGMGGNRFEPDAKITRAQVMSIVNRMLDRTPDADHMLPEMKKWTDNPEGTWYYADVQEATNGHDYTRGETNVETWTAIQAKKDWVEIEAGWAANNGASAPAAETETQGLPDGI